MSVHMLAERMFKLVTVYRCNIVLNCDCAVVWFCICDAFNGFVQVVAVGNSGSIIHSGGFARANINLSDRVTAPSTSVHAAGTILSAKPSQLVSTSLGEYSPRFAIDV